jgi:hypothetical protein
MKDYVLDAAVSGIAFTSAPFDYKIAVVMEHVLPASSDEGSSESWVFLPFSDSHFIAHASAFTMVQLIAGTVTIDPMITDLNVAFRLLPTTAVANLVVNPDAVFNDGFAQVQRFVSTLTVPQVTEHPILFPPEPYTRLVHGPASLAAPPCFVFQAKRVNRGGTTRAWKEMTVRVRFDFDVKVAGHGVLFRNVA